MAGGARLRFSPFYDLWVTPAKYGLSLVLVVIAAKMLGANWVNIPTSWALAAVACIILVSILLSALKVRRQGATETKPPPPG